MCFCERDAVKVMIHVKARKRYPGIKYHEETLGAVASRFNVTSTFQLHAMSEPELADLSKALLRSLPAEARPHEYRAAV
mgnify:CR=1 FL=1